MQGVNVTADLEAGFGVADASMGRDGRPDFHNVPTHPRSCRRGGVGTPPEGGAPGGGSHEASLRSFEWLAANGTDEGVEVLVGAHSSRGQERGQEAKPPLP